MLKRFVTHQINKDQGYLALKEVKRGKKKRLEGVEGTTYNATKMGIIDTVDVVRDRGPPHKCLVTAVSFRPFDLVRCCNLIRSF